MRKFLCALSIIVLLCGCASVVSADGGDCGNGVKWDFSDGTLTISYTGSGSGAMPDNSSPWSSHKGDIKTIIIGEGITHIGASAFSGYHTPTRAVISDTVTSIGASAFHSCWGINSLTMGKKVETIGDEAFLNCSGFTTLILPDSLKRIGSRAFYQCFDLETLTFMVPKVNNLHDLEVGSDAFGEKHKAAKIAYSSEKGILTEKNNPAKEVTEGSDVEKELKGRSLTWAKHTPTNYVITFDPNDGGMLKAGITTQRIPVNGSAQLFTKAKLDLQNLDMNLDFLGWATAKNAKKAVYEDGAVYTATDDTTLYAVWGKKRILTITFDANGGTFTAAETTISLNLGATVALTTAQDLGLSNEDQDLYFLGWSKKKDGAVNYRDGAECTPEADMTLYAVWRKNGDGSAGAPFLIDSWDRLKKLAQEVNGGKHYTKKYFMLTAEIGSETENWTPIGNSYSRSFNGIFDGDSHSIFYKISGSAESYQGLFGCIDTGGTVKNLKVAGSISGGGRYCGGVVGWVCTSGTIVNCAGVVDISFTATGEGKLGGIVGCNTGVVDYCAAMSQIMNNGVEGVRVGCIAGMNQSGTVSHCSAVGHIGSTRSYVGMVVGDNRDETSAAGTIIDCNYLTLMSDGYKGVGNKDGGSDKGTTPMSVDEIMAYAQKLGDEYAVCSSCIISGSDIGGNDEDDEVTDGGRRGSSGSGCDAGLWGFYGLVLASYFIRRR